MTTQAPSRRHLVPFRLQFEPRAKASRTLVVLTTLGAIAVALLISAVVIWMIGGDPVRAYIHIVRSSVASNYVISDTLVEATPLIFTGLACTVAFRMRLWNIGAEGQFTMGAWGAAAVVLVGWLPEGTSSWIVVPLMILAGIGMGAVWGGIAGWLKARFNVNEIITTLMMVYISINWVQYWVFGPWSEGGFQVSRRVEREFWLPRLTDYAPSLPDLGGLTLHLGFLIALAAAAFVWFLFNRTRKGYEIRLIGDNPRAARYAGINIGRNIILVMVISGALAGLGGAVEVAGVTHRLQDAIAGGAGFTGIIIAFIARFNPIGVVVASIAFGALILAGREIQPAGIPAMAQGIILFCVIASDVFLRYHVRLVRK